MAPKRARQEAREVERSEDDDLLKCLIQKVSPEVLVDDWLAEYDNENTKESAICQLLKLFIDLSGYTGKIPEDLVCGDHQKIMKDITANYCQSCSDSPLYNKPTRVQVAAFVQRLMQKSGASVLCDQYMMDKVTRYLSQMALSKVRPLRYVGTYLMLKIVTTSLNILMAIQQQELYAKRQSIIDQSKSESSRSIVHTEALNSRVTEFEETVKELNDMIFSYLIPCCFTKRYRDVCPEIVSFCMAELGCWMEMCPTNFQEKGYFDTYKIMLYHPSVNVRRTCLLALKQLFSKKSDSEVLLKLSQSLKGRLQHLTKDKSVEVAALALIVLATMVKCYGQSVLDVEGRKKKYSDGSVRTNTSILMLVYSKHLSIAYEAGKLLGHWLLQEPHSGDSEVNSSRTSVSSSTGDNSELLMQIVRFFTNSKLPNHAVYLIDALKGFDPVLTDWDAMTGPLLKHELEDAEEFDLIKVMRACVQVACGDTPPAGREKNFKKTTITRNRKRDNRTKMTDHFIPLMPRLLLQYRTDIDKVIELLKILHYLDLNQYKTPRQGMDLVAVVNAFETILDIKDSDSDEILKLCCCFLHKISEEEPSTSTTECNNIWRKIETRNFMNMKSLNSRVAPDLKQGNIIDMDDIPELEKYLRRLVVFSKYRNLGFLNLWDEVFVYIEKAASAVVPYHMTLHAIDICEQTLLWDLLTLCEREESQDDESAGGSSSSTGERAAQLRAQLVELLNVLLPPLERCRGRVARKCFVTICVLLNSFYYALPGNLALSSVWYEADEEVKTHLQIYTEEQFFRNGTGAPKDAKDRCECLRLYCELLVLYKLDIQAAVHILKYYHEVYKVYFGVIGWMLETMLDRRRNDAAGLMFEALMISFQELRSTGVVEEADLSQIKETADNFGKILSKFVRNREVIVFLHKQAILFACEEGSNNTLFLVPMMGLVSLLPAQDCMPMARLLDQQSKSFTDARQVQDPVARYRAKLLEGHARRSARGSKVASGAVASGATQGKSSGRKRGKVESSTPAVRTPKRPHKPKLDIRVKSTRNKEGKMKRMRASSVEGIDISNVSEICSSPQPGTSK